jgi:molecular chaperone DnaK
VVDLRIRYDDADAFVRAFMVDLELRGVYVPSSVPVAIGSDIDLTVEFGGGRGLKLGAVVATHRGEGADFSLGLRIARMQDKHRQWLTAAVKARLQERRDKASMPRPEHRLRTASADLDDHTVDVGALEIDAEGGVIIGIDLGTSNSAACYHGKDGLTLIELGEHKDRYLPSIVAYEEGGTVRVGKYAMAGLRRIPERTIFGAKRFIGRDYKSAEVQSMRTRYPYNIVAGAKGRCAVEIDGRRIDLAAVSAKILEEIRIEAEKRLGQKVERAIITVPAYYNQNQRFAVTQAGRLAGLQVERVLNEPTAAAIAYGLSYDTSKRILVYDLGGGTFDVSVMSVEKDKLAVLATAGDTFLGGEDFDDRIVNYAIGMFEKANPRKKLSRAKGALALLKEAAEQVKKRLSTKERTIFTVRDAVLEGGGSTRVECELDRAQLIAQVTDLVERTLAITDMALAEAGLARDSLDDVLLVGGQTVMPYVRERVAQHLGITPRADLPPHEVVAMGAGTLAYLRRTRSSRRFLDVLSMSIGVEIPGGRMKAVLAQNTKVPCERSFKVTVPAARFADFALEVYQGEAERVAQNEHLGAIPLAGFDPGDHDPVPLAFDFALSADCMLRVIVRNLATEQSVEAILAAAMD